MASITSFSGDVIAQYGEVLSAIEDSDTNHQSLTEYAMAIMLRGESKEELEFAEGEVQRICRLYGNYAHSAPYRCQLPRAISRGYEGQNGSLFLGRER